MKKNIVGYIKFPPSWGKITTITKSFSISVLQKEKQGCKFFCFCSPPLGTIGESIAAIRRFHSLRSFHQRLLKVGPLRGPEVICETRVLYKAFAPSGRRAKCDDTQGDALGYEFLPLQGVGACRKGAAEIYMLLLPYSFVSSHHRKVSKYTLHLKRLQFFFCQSCYLHDLRPRHTHCQQVTGYSQTFR